MLKIIFGDNKDNIVDDNKIIYNTEIYFKNVYKNNWIVDEFSKKIIRDVDKSIVVNESNIQSPVLGVIHPLQLSGGVKTLILMNFDKKNIYNASNCGDNCSKWIIEMAKEKILTINLRHIMHFDFKNMDVDIKILNSGMKIKTEKEYVYEAVKYI